MSESDVTRSGVRGVGGPRDAITGGTSTRRRRRGKRERPMVPDAEFTSYYGKPVINGPVWQARDIASYLFLGGLAGASSLVSTGAAATGRHTLESISACGAAGAGALSLAALVDDLGRPARFLNMLRVFKPTSPMSVGSWLLAGYVPAAAVAAASAVTGKARRIGRAAGAAASVAGPGVASYTAALVSDTAVPAWHDAYSELPFVFVGSGAAAAGGLGMMSPIRESAPARNLALFGAGCELASFEWMRRRVGMTAEPYATGTAGRYHTASTALSVAGAAGAVLGRRNRLASALSGAALLAASAATRWCVFHAGLASADDPKYTVIPQRERLSRG